MMRQDFHSRGSVPNTIRNFKRTACPKSEDCGCFSGIKPVIARQNNHGQSMLHMDECDDPECLDYEQLRELQKSIEKYTDYDHYEKCCDGHHHHRYVADNTNNCCSDVGDMCCEDSATTQDDCEDCVDDCDECIEEHQQLRSQLETPTSLETTVGCEDDCTQCEEDCEENGHDRKDCPQDHHSSWDSCITTCDVCVDSIPLGTLGPALEFDLYGINSMLPHVTPCDDNCNNLTQSSNSTQSFMAEPPFDTELDHWQTFQQAHHCAPDPCLVGQLSQFQRPQHVEPNFGFTFGCDPSVPGNQYPWQQQFVAKCGVQAFEGLGLNEFMQDASSIKLPLTLSNDPVRTNISAEPVTVKPQGQTSEFENDRSSRNRPQTPTRTGKACQWLMPCGSICGATFARTEDLKKHVKNSHQSIKGTVTCRWNGCSASFATEPALTGHISKKHIAPLAAAAAEAGDVAEEGPWKCTVAGCTKSFMYKQVRDEHVASHSGGNKAHCPICHQWLNAEGSNFRRHMLSHRPENEHMRCKHQHLGCRRKFPRLDNLRRHEACCKYGKRAAAAAGVVEVKLHTHHDHGLIGHHHGRSHARHHVHRLD